MNKKILLTFVSTCALLASMGETHAAEESTPIPAVTNARSFEVTPYLWAPGIKGTLGLDNGLAKSADFSSSNVVSNLKSGGMISAEAHNGNWGVMVTISEILVNVDKITSGEMEIDQFVDGLVDPNAEDIKLGPEEPEVDPDAEEGGEEGEDENSGGGGAATANAKQLDELKQISLEKFAIVRTQADKMRRAFDKEGYNCPAYIKAQEAIRGELLGFRLTAKSVEKLCDTMR